MSDINNDDPGAGRGAEEGGTEGGGDGQKKGKIIVKSVASARILLRVNQLLGDDAALAEIEAHGVTIIRRRNGDVYVEKESLMRAVNNMRSRMSETVNLSLNETTQKHDGATVSENARAKNPSDPVDQTGLGGDGGGESSAVADDSGALDDLNFDTQGSSVDLSDAAKKAILQIGGNAPIKDDDGIEDILVPIPEGTTRKGSFVEWTPDLVLQIELKRSYNIEASSSKLEASRKNVTISEMQDLAGVRAEVPLEVTTSGQIWIMDDDGRCLECIKKYELTPACRAQLDALPEAKPAGRASADELSVSDSDVLDEPLDLGGSSVEQLELPETDDAVPVDSPQSGERLNGGSEVPKPKTTKVPVDPNLESSIDVRTNGGRKKLSDIRVLAQGRFSAPFTFSVCTDSGEKYGAVYIGNSQRAGVFVDDLAQLTPGATAPTRPVTNAALSGAAATPGTPTTAPVTGSGRSLTATAASRPHAARTPTRVELRQQRQDAREAAEAGYPEQDFPDSMRDFIRFEIASGHGFITPATLTEMENKTPTGCTLTHGTYGVELQTGNLINDDGSDTGLSVLPSDLPSLRLAIAAENGTAMDPECAFMGDLDGKRNVMNLAGKKRVLFKQNVHLHGIPGSTGPMTYEEFMQFAGRNLEPQEDFHVDANSGRVYVRVPAERSASGQEGDKATGVFVVGIDLEKMRQEVDKDDMAVIDNRNRDIGETPRPTTPVRGAPTTRKRKGPDRDRSWEEKVSGKLIDLLAKLIPSGKTVKLWTIRTLLLGVLGGVGYGGKKGYDAYNYHQSGGSGESGGASGEGSGGDGKTGGGEGSYGGDRK